MHRNQAGSTWVRKAVTFNAAAVLAGLGAGAALGFLGGLLPEQPRIGVALLLCAAAIPVAVLELTGRRLPPLQRNHETPQRWLHRGPIRWAIRNGAVLGIAVTSRLGFWLWYVVPLAALLSGSAWWGMVDYGTYGGVRAAGVWLLLAPPLRGRGVDGISPLQLLRRMPLARRAAAFQLLAVALAVGGAFLTGGRPR